MGVASSPAKVYRDFTEASSPSYQSSLPFKTKAEKDLSSGSDIESDYRVPVQYLDKDSREAAKRFPWYNKITKEEAKNVKFRDLENPYTVYAFLDIHPKDMIKWLQHNGILAKRMKCPKCG